MALSTFVKDNCQGRLYLVRGATELLVPFDNGDLSIEGINRTLNEVLKFEGRGKIQGTNLGARMYPSISFTAKIAEFTNVTAGVITDFLNRSNGYSAVVSSEGTNHPVDTIGMRYEIEGNSFGDDADSTVTLARVAYTYGISESEGSPTTISISGEVLGAITGGIAAAERA